jgi:hypothetical protein
MVGWPDGDCDRPLPKITAPWSQLQSNSLTVEERTRRTERRVDPALHIPTAFSGTSDLKIRARHREGGSVAKYCAVLSPDVSEWDVFLSEASFEIPTMRSKRCSKTHELERNR